MEITKGEEKQQMTWHDIKPKSCVSIKVKPMHSEGTNVQKKGHS